MKKEFVVHLEFKLIEHPVFIFLATLLGRYTGEVLPGKFRTSCEADSCSLAKCNSLQPSIIATKEAERETMREKSLGHSWG